MPRVELGEVGSAALLLAVVVAGIAFGRWQGRWLARRALGRRITGLEREVERLAIEVARLDSTAVLWQTPPDLPADVGSDAPH